MITVVETKRYHSIVEGLKAVEDRVRDIGCEDSEAIERIINELARLESRDAGSCKKTRGISQ